MIGVKTRALIVVLATSLLLTGSVQVASASHKEYFSEDGNKQRTTPPNFENYVYWFWRQGGKAWWWAEPSLRPDVLVVIGNWQAAIPELPFEEPVNPAEADLRFVPEPCDFGFPACFPLGLVLWQPDDIQKANFVLKATIRLDINHPWFTTEQRRREALAHELGHFYGLHERYVDDPLTFECNNIETTVMDALGCDNLQGPAFVDIQRVRNYWNTGSMAWMTPQLQGTDILWKWTDRGWSEYHQQFNAFWWDWTINDWRQYVQWFPYQDRIGLHEAMASFTEARILSRTTTSPPESRDRWHVACGHPWFPNRGYGTWTCSSVTFVPSADLAGFWRLDEVSGITAHDDTSYGNHGTLVNGPVWVPGKVNNALSLDGLDDYVNVSDSSSLTFGAGSVDRPFSIALWAKPDVITGKVNGLVSKAVEYNQGEYALLLEWSRVTFRVIDNSARASLARNADNAVSTSGVWYHIVGTYDGSRAATGIAIYVNGGLANSADASGGTYVAMEDTSYSVSLGDYRPTDPDRFDGLLDEVRVYNRALTADEVWALYNIPGG